MAIGSRSKPRKGTTRHPQPRGVTRGDKGGTIPRAPNHCGAVESPSNVTSTFSNAEHGRVKLAPCPGRHLAPIAAKHPAKDAAKRVKPRCDLTAHGVSHLFDCTRRVSFRGTALRAQKPTFFATEMTRALNRVNSTESTRWTHRSCKRSPTN